MKMEKITNFKEVSPLVLKYFKRGVLTNNFLGTEEYKAEIEEEGLFYEAGEEWLNLYVKRDGFFQLYFYALSENAAFPEVQGTLIADVVGEGTKVMENNGFEKILERIKLEVNTEKEPIEAGIRSEKTDAEEIFAIMKKTFDPYTGFAPNFAQVSKECEAGLYYKHMEEGKIAGVLRLGKSGKTAQIKHLCVLEEYSGKGIGKKLTKAFLDENPKAIVWTGKENAAALHLYKSLGFCESETESIVYRKSV